MTEMSRHWDGASLGDASYAPYTALKWAEQERLEHGQGAAFPNYGILKGTGDGTYSPLRFQATSPASANVEIRPGAALVHGYLYENSATINLAVGANASGNPRIDTALLRVDFVAQTVRAVLKQGTPAVSPTRPTLQQDTSIWEIPLGDVAVANGFTTISNANITPRGRTIQSLMNGWMPYAYPLNHVVNGAYGNANVILADETAIAVPVYFGGNILLEDAVIRAFGPVLTTVDYGLYIQDVNDGNTAENTLRLITSGTKLFNIGTTTNVSLPFSPIPIEITPGLYWFVLNNNGGSILGLAGLTSSALETFGYLRFLGALNITQTLDMVTGWTVQADKVGIVFRGRVFGMTTVL